MNKNRMANENYNNEEQEVKFNKSRLVIPSILGSMVLVLMYVYDNSNKPMEKIFMLAFAFTFILPIGVNYLNFIMRDSIKKPKNSSNFNRKVNGNVNTYVASKSKNKGNSEQINTSGYKKGSKTNNLPEYNNLRTIIITSSQKKLLSRRAVLKFKAEVDYVLDGSKQNYDKMKFKNDLHEIYVKIKSSKLTKDDYIYLTAQLQELVD